MRNAVFFFLVTLLIAGLPFAQEAAPAKEVTGGDELVQKKGFFAGTWVHPDADITRYSKLYLWDAVFQFREGGETSSGTTIGTSRGDQAPYAVRDESKKKFEQVVSDSFVKALGQSKIFEVVDEVGPNTLIVRAAVLDIVSDVPPTRTGVNDVYLAAVGEATFVFELFDAETGVIQARVAERRRIQPPGRMNEVSSVPANSATVWSDVKLWANDVGQDVRRALEKAHKKAKK
jgi:hypothetical protein